jgi:adenine-specific DNA-methyltransferase
MSDYRNIILHGDCLHFLPELKEGSADFVLTDPPYLTNYHSRDGRSVPNDDNDAWLVPAFSELYRVLGRDRFCISFYGWAHADRFIAAWRAAGFHLVGHLTFPKRYTSITKLLRYQHENAYVLAKGFPENPAYPIGDVLDWTYSGNKLHPTQKPLSVLLPLIETFSKPGDMVLDPFCGSGSTLVAAHMLGRGYLGIEVSAEYHVIAACRLEASQGCSTLLTDSQREYCVETTECGGVSVLIECIVLIAS